VRQYTAKFHRTLSEHSLQPYGSKELQCHQLLSSTQADFDQSPFHVLQCMAWRMTHIHRQYPEITRCYKQTLRKSIQANKLKRTEYCTRVFGYHKYTINASFASLYIGNLRKNRIISKEVSHYPKFQPPKVTKNSNSKSSMGRHYHDTKLSPTLSSTVRNASKILQKPRPYNMKRTAYTKYAPKQKGRPYEPVLTPEPQLLDLRPVQLHRLVAVVRWVRISENKPARQENTSNRWQVWWDLTTLLRSKERKRQKKKLSVSLLTLALR
jgi:hypothetical protein